MASLIRGQREDPPPGSARLKPVSVLSSVLVCLLRAGHRQETWSCGLVGGLDGQGLYLLLQARGWGRGGALQWSPSHPVQGLPFPRPHGG